jgi:hypothetical protein
LASEDTVTFNNTPTSTAVTTENAAASAKGNNDTLIGSGLALAFTALVGGILLWRHKENQAQELAEQAAMKAREAAEAAARTAPQGGGEAVPRSNRYRGRDTGSDSNSLPTPTSTPASPTTPAEGGGGVLDTLGSWIGGVMAKAKKLGAVAPRPAVAVTENTPHTAPRVPGAARPTPRGSARPEPEYVRDGRSFRRREAAPTAEGAPPQSITFSAEEVANLRRMDALGGKGQNLKQRYLAKLQAKYAASAVAQPTQAATPTAVPFWKKPFAWLDNWIRSQEMSAEEIARLNASKPVAAQEPALRQGETTELQQDATTGLQPETATEGLSWQDKARGIADNLRTEFTGLYQSGVSRIPWVRDFVGTPAAIQNNQHLLYLSRTSTVEKAQHEIAWHFQQTHARININWYETTMELEEESQAVVTAQVNHLMQLAEQSNTNPKAVLENYKKSFETHYIPNIRSHHQANCRTAFENGINKAQQEKGTTTGALKPTVKQGTDTLIQAVSKTTAEHLTAINGAPTLDTCHTAILEHLQEKGLGAMRLNLTDNLTKKLTPESKNEIHQHLDALATHGGLTPESLGQYLENMFSHLKKEGTNELIDPVSRACYQQKVLLAIWEHTEVRKKPWLQDHLDRAHERLDAYLYDDLEHNAKPRLKKLWAKLWGNVPEEPPLNPLEGLFPRTGGPSTPAGQTVQQLEANVESDASDIVSGQLSTGRSQAYAKLQGLARLDTEHIDFITKNTEGNWVLSDDLKRVINDHLNTIKLNEDELLNYAETLAGVHYEKEDGMTHQLTNALSVHRRLLEHLQTHDAVAEDLKAANGPIAKAIQAVGERIIRRVKQYQLRSASRNPPSGPGHSRA